MVYAFTQNQIGENIWFAFQYSTVTERTITKSNVISFIFSNQSLSIAKYALFSDKNVSFIDIL